MAARASASAGWQFDEFDDGSQNIVGTVQLKNYREFLQEFSKQLLDIEDALDDTLSEAWDNQLDPIALDFSPRETISVLDLVKTENKVFSKVMAVFIAICREISELRKEAETTLYAPLFVYGEGGSELNDDGDAQLQMGELLPLLQRLLSFSQRVNEVVKNAVQQLAMLHTTADTAHSLDARDVHMLTVFKALGEILMVLITLDEVIAGNALLNQHWDYYKRMIKSVHSNPPMFGVSLEQLQPLERLLQSIEGHLFAPNVIFQECIHQVFDDATVTVSSNQALREEFALAIRTLLATIEPRLGEASERDMREQYGGLIGLIVFSSALFSTIDKKLIKAIFDVQRKLPVIHLFGTALMVPTTFLVSLVPSVAKVLDKRMLDAVAPQKEFLARTDASFANDTQALYTAACSWMIKMENLMPSMALPELLEFQSNMLTKGVLLAYQISNLLKTFVNLHMSLGVPMGRSLVRSVFRLLELLKAIEQTFHRRVMHVSAAYQHIAQQLSQTSISVITEARRRLQAEQAGARSFKNRSIDILAALNLLEVLVFGPSTAERRLAINMALHVAAQGNVFAPAKLDLLQNTLRKCETLAVLQKSIRTACDTSFFYWQRNLMEIYFQDLYESPVDAPRLQYVFAALRDGLAVLRAVQAAIKPPFNLPEHFVTEITELFERVILTPLCQDIETDLRLQIHTGVVRLDERNPFKQAIKDLSHFLKIGPLRFGASAIDIKGRVSQYLDTTFYNLTTVALHDWSTYAQMRSLAMQKYGLELSDPALPSQTLEQGLDVLAIMRKIHMFVAKYLYNLNTQIFIEKGSKNKFLNTINIRHVANSIRTHGTGIMNTTVNFTYQFLSRKLFIFSQFLFDDHIKSRLIKDIRFFREERGKMDQRFPFERAERFTKTIRKLGVNEAGETCLDQFRALITEIGNAMGYIRLIRSGGLHCCSDAIRFVPDLDNIESFERMAQDEHLNETTVAAARNVDSVVQSLFRNFAEGTEYFKMLVDIFSKELRAEKNSHLRNFYVIVPPLTINFVEHMIMAKDRLNKKNKTGAMFTDDGFAMGLAYILKLLDQYEQFDSLHWFRSCRDHYALEKDKARKADQSAKSKDDDKLQEAVALSLKKIGLYEKEMDLLFYSLSSARIFFRADQTAAEEKQQEEEKAAEAAAAAPAAAPDAPVAGAAPAAPPPPPAQGGAPPPPPPPLPVF
eukprot:m.226982 g.226982  ORF g.226982 m.226982 type:complete len:1195 (+) comp17088_c0_seq1:325-3909(+)